MEELRRQLEASSSAVTAALKEEHAKEQEERERRHQVCRSSPPLLRKARPRAVCQHGWEPWGQHRRRAVVLSLRRQR